MPEPTDPTFTLAEMRAAFDDGTNVGSDLKIQADRALHRMYGPYLERMPEGVGTAFREGYMTAALVGLATTKPTL